SLWVNCMTRPTPQQAYAVMIGKFNQQSPTASEWLIGMDNTGKVFLATTGAGTVTRLTSPAALPTNQWIHVCGAWNKNGNAELFINGASVGSALLQAPIAGNTPVMIGDACPANGAHYFSGKIDEIKIWSKTADRLFVTNLYKTVPDNDKDGVADFNDPDDNNDGIPDEWAFQFFGDRLAGTPGADPDQDGYKNLEEYIAGSHPNDKRSCFMTWDATPTNLVAPKSLKGISIECDGLAGRVYQVYTSPLLRGAGWTAFGSAVTCSVNNLVHLTAPATNKFSFYRVTVRMK
ncbi:MAG: LamG domain-containing protein, partial [Lentisphaerota bacterium]